MSNEQQVIITVAITGSTPTKAETAAVPVTPSQQIESTQEAFEAGAALVHIHVRNPDESPSSDPALFAKVQEGILRYCPGMIIQFSTSDKNQDGAVRSASLPLRPDMASLSTGSVNFRDFIYANSPQLVRELAERMNENDVKPEVEVFDVSMLYTAHSMANAGLLKRPLHIQFVLGGETGKGNTLPMREQLLDFLVSELKALEPDASWAAVGIGRSQLIANHWSLRRGGHVRTGLEDNIRFDQVRLARSNAELVTRLVDVCAEYGRRPATPTEARAILHLRPVETTVMAV